MLVEILPIVDLCVCVCRICAYTTIKPIYIVLLVAFRLLFFATSTIPQVACRTRCYITAATANNNNGTHLCYGSCFNHAHTHNLSLYIFGLHLAKLSFTSVALATIWRLNLILKEELSLCVWRRVVQNVVGETKGGFVFFYKKSLL